MYAQVFMFLALCCVSSPILSPNFTLALSCQIKVKRPNNIFLKKRIIAAADDHLYIQCLVQRWRAKMPYALYNKCPWLCWNIFNPSICSMCALCECETQRGGMKVREWVTGSRVEEARACGGSSADLRLHSSAWALSGSVACNRLTW